MTSVINDNSSITMNTEICTAILSTLKDLKKDAIKLRFELAEMQTQLMFLYKYPYLEILKSLENFEVYNSMEVNNGE